MLNQNPYLTGYIHPAAHAAARAYAQYHARMPRIQPIAGAQGAQAAQGAQTPTPRYGAAQAQAQSARTSTRQAQGTPPAERVFPPGSRSYTGPTPQPIPSYTPVSGPSASYAGGGGYQQRPGWLPGYVGWNNLSAPTQDWIGSQGSVQQIMNQIYQWGGPRYVQDLMNRYGEGALPMLQQQNQAAPNYSAPVPSYGPLPGTSEPQAATTPKRNPSRYTTSPFGYGGRLGV